MKLQLTSKNSTLRPMRLICFSPRYFPAVGGAESYVIALAERFAADGHTVTVITSDALDFQLFWQPAARRIDLQTALTQHNGVNIIRLPIQHLPFVPLSYHAWRRGLWCLSHLPFVPATSIGRLARQTPHIPSLWDLNDFHADAIFGFNICYEPFLWAAKKLADKLSVPFIAVPFTHLGAGNAPAADAQSGFYTMRHQVAVVNQADVALMQTQSEKDFYISKGASAERIHIASAGIDPDDYGNGDGQRWRKAHHIPADRPIIAFIGTHDIDKGTTHLIEAAERLWANGVEFELVLAGTHTAEFEQYLTTISTETKQRMHLLGRISDSDKQDLLAALDLFVMVSRIDSFGIVFLEAWLYGKPVIGSTAWGMADVIDENQDGLLVPFGDTPALAHAIKTLLADPKRCKQMGQHGRTKTLAQHPWNQKHATVSQILTKLLATKSEAAA
ncbi:MAG: glycosyltransferase family 4 protein [Anaerolineae bacterium]